MAKAILVPVSRNVAWLFLGEVGVKGGVLLVAALVARGMGAEGVGVFTVALGVVLVATPLLALGQVEVLIRDVARTPRSARRLAVVALRGQRRVLAGLALPAAVIIALVPDAALRHTLLALLPYVWFRVETLTRGAIFKGLDRMGVEAQARALEMGTAVALVAALAVLGLPVWAVGAAFSLGGAVGLGFLLRSMRSLPAELPSGATSSGQLRQGLPFMAIAGVFQLLLRSDVFALELFGVPHAEIGHYGAAASLVWGLLGGAQLVAVAIYPSVSRIATRSTNPGRSAVVAGGVGLVLGLAGATVLVVLRRPLLGLVFGSGFVSTAAPLLATLAWVLPAASASMVLGVVSAAWHRQRLGLAVYSIVLLAAVGLELWWIPHLGAAGAARAVVVAHLLAVVGVFAVASWPAAPGERTGRA